MGEQRVGLLDHPRGAHQPLRGGGEVARLQCPVPGNQRRRPALLRRERAGQRHGGATRSPLRLVPQRRLLCSQQARAARLAGAL